MPNVIISASLLLNSNVSVELANSISFIDSGNATIASNISFVVSNTIVSNGILKYESEDANINLQNAVTALSTFSITTGEEAILYDQTLSSQLWYTS